MRVSNGRVLAVMFVTCQLAAPVRAQTNAEQPLVDANGESIIGRAGVPYSVTHADC